MNAGSAGSTISDSFGPVAQQATTVTGSTTPQSMSRGSNNQTVSTPSSGWQGTAHTDGTYTWTFQYVTYTVSGSATASGDVDYKGSNGKGAWTHILSNVDVH